MSIKNPLAMQLGVNNNRKVSAFHGSAIRVTRPDKTISECFLHACNRQFALIYHVAAQYTVSNEGGDFWYEDRITRELVDLKTHHIDVVHTKECSFNLPCFKFNDLIKRKQFGAFDLESCMNYMPVIGDMRAGKIITVTSFGQENIYFDSDHIALIVKDEFQVLFELDGVATHWKNAIDRISNDRANYLGDYQIIECDLKNYSVTLRPVTKNGELK